jgi:hypothetical protein
LISIMNNCITITAASADVAQWAPRNLHKIFMANAFVHLTTTGALALGAAATPRRYRPSALHLTQEEGAWLTVTAWLRRAIPHGVCR